MTEAEVALFKGLAKEFAEKELPAILEVEMQRVPQPYAGIVEMVYNVLKPQMIAALDAKIEAIFSAQPVV